MKFLSVCSGIEAASVAWGPLGWEAVGFSEIEPFPSAVLAHHHPGVPNHGDMTKLVDMIDLGLIDLPDVFCGGTPCQAFSVAGLRKSLDDERGNLSLVFCEIANAIDDERAAAGLEPGVVFWENVPGVLSTKDNAFGCFLAGLAGEDEPLVAPGGKWTDAGFVLGPQRAVAWRVLDAQYFGLAQRRRRVFVVASARTDFDPAAVLFEFQGVRRDSAPSREAGQGTAHDTAPCLTSSGRGVERTGDTRGQDPVVAVAQPYATANCLTDRMHKGIDSTLDEGQTPVVAFHPTQDPISSTDVCHGISANAQATAAVAFQQTADCLTAAYGTKWNGNASATNGSLFAASAMQVRRLTPVECERLQGFPDHYTAIPWRGKSADQCPDGPRYKALGNSWAVPVVRWIGARIDLEVMGLLG